MAKRGRKPFEITPEVIAKAEALAAQGLTLDQIALVLGIATGTLCAKKSEIIELDEAIKRGKAKGVATIANALFDKAKEGDNTAMIFYLKARAGWRDNHVDLTSSDGSMSPVDSSAAILEAISRKYDSE